MRLKRITSIFLFSIVLIIFTSCPVLTEMEDIDLSELGVEYIISEEMGTDGGLISISDTGTDIDGISISVPPDALALSTEIRVSIAEEQYNSSVSGFQVLTPTINFALSNEQEFSAPVEITIPRKDGVTFSNPIIISYDSEIDSYDFFPVIDANSKSLTYIATHFSDHTAIDVSTSSAPLNTNFLLPDDSPAFINWKADDTANCFGMSSFAMWWDSQFNENLHDTKYPEIDLKSIIVEIQDRQEEVTGKNLIEQAISGWNIIADTLTGNTSQEYLFNKMYASLQNNGPQLVGMYDTDTNTTPHAILVYGWDGANFLVYDSNNINFESELLTYDAANKIFNYPKTPAYDKFVSFNHNLDILNEITEEEFNSYPTIYFTNVFGGDVFIAGETYTLNWESANTIGDVSIEFQEFDPVNSFFVTEGTINDGELTLTIPSNVTPMTYYLKISDELDTHNTYVVDIEEGQNISLIDNSNISFTPGNLFYPSDFSTEITFADSGILTRPGVFVMNQTGKYEMWFTGSSYKITIGYATSADGLNWTVENGPAIEGSVLQHTSNQHYHAQSPNVVYENGTYKMWYVTESNGFATYAHATSSDGINWTQQGTVLSSNDATALPFHVHNNGGASLSVIKDGTTYKMWYTGSDATNSSEEKRIGYAESTDGINWTRISGSGWGGSVLDIGTAGMFDSKYAYAPQVIKINDIYHMYYYGSSSADGAGVGYATSADGVAWTKHYDSASTNGEVASLNDKALWVTPFVDGSDIVLFYREPGTTETNISRALLQ